eukprot:CAMPEP_0206474158 /NCGR_PEP_ID=MMETSP0324_2-20121206/33310_1 /ASSEMBLY_ACC=CAM_ASM_000836 /TAXON_ID=2866 /ORGANISM="Crypthecodinium cohnii, Strain Seligo" /LENGTH=81 /DNA_ID=CAMNT_0053949257 /DNA_START=210 /DNA_END=455 /DNA_ORIENTATION=-
MVRQQSIGCSEATESHPLQLGRAAAVEPDDAAARESEPIFQLFMTPLWTGCWHWQSGLARNLQSTNLCNKPQPQPQQCRTL